ncbi:flagellar protein FlaG [Pseudomonas sp. ALS1131]|nr:flagellar protein FlaG [Pseudomonas sp. ALS1131]TRO37710.1 flagellar protein FlaG [Pseudomonas sp. ALS1131]
MDISKLTSPPAPVVQGRDMAQAAEIVERPSVLSVAEQSPADDGPARDLDAAVASMSSFVQSVQRNLAFSIDESSGDVVIKVVEHESGKLVRQIPSEEALRLSEQLEELRSLMFEARA